MTCSSIKWKYLDKYKNNVEKIFFETSLNLTKTETFKRVSAKSVNIN